MEQLGPCDAAMPAATSWMRRTMSAFTGAVKVRMLPEIRTSDAMTFGATPPSIRPSVSTALSVGDTLRLTSIWSAVTSCAATTTGSTVPCGAEAWPPVPRTSSSTESEFAVTGPAAQPRVPADA